MVAMHSTQTWVQALGICKIPNIQMVISPIKHVIHPTANTCCFCWYHRSWKELLFQQDRQCTYTCNNEALVRNYCCSGKAIRTTYSEFVSVCSLDYPACNTHVLSYIVICGLSGFTVFFHIIQ
jgi:hypothetical protein